MDISYTHNNMFKPTASVRLQEVFHVYLNKGSLTVWALYAYFSDSQNAAFELLVWCM